MWAILAAAALILGQLYLLRCLKKLDRVLEASDSEEDGVGKPGEL